VGNIEGVKGVEEGGMIFINLIRTADDTYIVAMQKITT
jgi:hypothetical protein